MRQKIPLSSPELRIEELRAIRRRLFGGAGMELEKLRELGNQIPKGFRVLRGVRPVVPLAAQLAARERAKKAAK